MRKGKLFICLILVLALVLTAGCGKKEEAAAEPAAVEVKEEAPAAPEATPVSLYAEQTEAEPVMTEEAPAGEIPEEIIMAMAPEESAEGGHAFALYAFDVDENIAVDFSGEGDPVTVCVYPTEDGDSDAIVLELDGQPYRLIDDVTAFNGAWVYYYDGDITLFFAAETDEDGSCLYSCRQENGAPVLKDHILGVLSGITDDGSLKVGRSVDVLGSWWAEGIYLLKEDASFVPAGELFEIDMTEPEEGYPLTKAEVACEILSAKGYQADKLKKGVEVIPVATDDETYIYFIVADGREGRIPFTRGEGNEVLIGGKVETTYFDHIG